MLQTTTNFEQNLEVQEKQKRKYTAPREKIEMYSEKYGLTKQEVKRILTEDEAVLTLEELKIRYDNPNLGVLPEWLSEESLDKIIWKTVHSMYNNQFSYWITKEDLYVELHLWVRKISCRFDSYQELKVCCVNHVKYMLQQQGNYFRNVPYSLNAKVMGESDNNKQDNCYTYENKLYATNATDKNFEEMEFINLLDSITNKVVRNTLIITSYLCCGLDFLKDKYTQIYEEADDKLKERLKHIEEEVEFNTELKKLRDRGEYTDKRKRNIQFSKVIRAMGLNTVATALGVTTFKHSTNCGELTELFKKFIVDTDLMVAPKPGKKIKRTKKQEQVEEQCLSPIKVEYKNKKTLLQGIEGVLANERKEINVFSKNIYE